MLFDLGVLEAPGSSCSRESLAGPLETSPRGEKKPSMLERSEGVLCGGLGVVIGLMISHAGGLQHLPSPKLTWKLIEGPIQRIGVL